MNLNPHRTRIARAAAAAGICAALIAAAGCSNSSTGSEESSQAASSSAAAPSSGGQSSPAPQSGSQAPSSGGNSASGDYTKALLPADALPSGLQRKQIDLADVPVEQLKQQMQQLKVKPDRCSSLFEGALRALDEGEGAVLAARGRTGSVQNSVSPLSNDQPSVEKTLKACSDVTVSFGQQISGSSTTTIIDAPDVDAETVVAYKQETDFDVPPEVEKKAGTQLEQLGNTTAVVMRDGDLRVMVTTSGDPGVSALDLAPKALQQAHTALG